MTTRVHGAGDQEECFQYDHLRRLTQAWTQVNGACTTPQRAGNDPYWRTWSFDTIGNRATQVDKNPVTGDTTWTYQNGAAGSVAPHQVKQVTSSGPLAGPTRTFGYDAAGNTLTRTTDSGASQTLTWDEEAHLATLTEAGATTAYLYHSSGERMVAATTGKKTLYLPDGTELEKLGSSNPVGTRYYNGIAVRIGSTLKWAFDNHQASNVVQIDSVSQNYPRRRLMPYGEPRGAQPASIIGTKGFVGGTRDDTGLIHLGAREYDPTLGRFLSVDPIMDLTDPQQWHAYTYANASPVTNSDPDGRLLCGDEGCNLVAITIGAKPGAPKKIKGTPRSEVAPCAPKCDPRKGLKAPQWAAHGDYVQQVAVEHGLDPSFLLANLIMEGWTCFYLEPLCGETQWLQVELPSWLPGGQGDSASVGLTNFDKATFDLVKGRHPDRLGGHEWTDMIDNPKLSIDVMALHFSDLAASLPADLSKSNYTKNELLRYGYRNNATSMAKLAHGGKMEQEDADIIRRHHNLYDLARRWYQGSYVGEPLSLRARPRPRG